MSGLYRVVVLLGALPKRLLNSTHTLEPSVACARLSRVLLGALVPTVMLSMLTLRDIAHGDRRFEVLARVAVVTSLAVLPQGALVRNRSLGCALCVLASLE